MPTTNQNQPRPEYDHLRAFVARHRGVEPKDVRLDVQPLQGGLESVAVLRVHAWVSGKSSQPSSRAGGAGGMDKRHRNGRALAFVVKRLEGEPSREAAIYQHLVEPVQRFAAPALLDIEHLDRQSCRLYLEWVSPALIWPWRHTSYILRVIEQLAEMHATPPEIAGDLLSDWDYEEQVVSAAQDTLTLFEHARHDPALARVRHALPALRRVVDDLPVIRRHLLDFAPLGPAVLHGDVHSGNVLIGRTRRARADDAAMLLRTGGQGRPLFIDWGRARIGSPLEDVSSWLQSLGFWEPAARRRHDTLLARYLEARGLPPLLGEELRDAYWLASASNVLAGALQYYLTVALEPPPPQGQQADGQAQPELDALADCLRIIRRADERWRRWRANHLKSGLKSGRLKRGRSRGHGHGRKARHGTISLPGPCPDPCPDFCPTPCR